MLYIIITISLILLSAFILLPKFSAINKRYSLGINYLLTLVATLVGVLLAISITNHESNKKEQQDVIKLLGSSISSVETCHEYTKVLIEYYDELPVEDPLKTEFYTKNEPPYPEYLDIFLMQNIVSKNLSGDALSELNEKVINLKRSRNTDATVYLSFLEQTLKVLSSELAYQKEEIDKEKLKRELSGL